MVLQLLAGGLSIGAVYAMIAIGFTLLWQTSRTINFAQGEFITFPAFFMVLFVVVLKMPYVLALVSTILVAILFLGFVIRRTLIQALMERGGMLPIVIATIALSLLIRNAFLRFWTSTGLTFEPIVGQEPIQLGRMIFSSLDLCNVLIAASMITSLQLFVRRTKPGKALQAVAQNRESARIIGINVARMITLAFIINAALTAMAAILIAPIYLVKYDMGVELGLKAFYSAIIGGFNQVRGALVGGLILGVAESLTAAYLSTEYKVVIVLVILIAVILIKPEGLLGTKEEGI